MRKTATAVGLAAIAPLLAYAQDADSPASVARTTPVSFRLYRSDDQGASWHEAGTGLPSSQRINALAVDGSLCFAGTDDGLFVSVDEGRTWAPSPIRPAPRVQCLAVHGRRVYAGTKGAGVLVSDDGGRSWRPAARGLTDANIRSLATRGPVVYAGTDAHGVFALPPEADSWAPLGRGLPELCQVFDLAIAGQHVYAALYSQGLYRVGVEGSRWERVGEVTPLEFLVRGEGLIAGHNPGGIYRSVDGGATWSRAGGLPGDPPIWVLGSAGPNLLAGTTPGAVALSDDSGATWRPAATGLPPGAAVVAIGDGERFALSAIVLQGVR